ncbi:MAG TPA: sugar ABC transporter substrate-binding protein [Ignavibacteriaceae bacterium]|nr:sugar ABC transporter substrate-binding protein [Ignavibacteriaceae bacterium]
MKIKNLINFFIILFALAIIGCSSRNDDKIHIKFWAIGAEGEKVAKLIPEFEKQNPKIKIDIQQIPWTAAHEKLITAYAGETLPDCYQIGNTWVAEFSQLDAIEPLDKYIEKSSVIKKENYFPGIWESNVMNNVVYSIPWYVDTRVMFYRTDMLMKAGYNEFPKTWSEFYKAAEKIKEQTGNYGIFLPTNEWQPYIIFGYQKGADFLKNNWSYGNFSSPQFISAMNFVDSMYSSGVALYDMQKVMNVYQSFGAGYFAFYITGPWNVFEMNRSLPESIKDKWMTAPMPSFDNDYPGYSSAGGASLVISKYSKNKDAAWKWIEFLSEKETQIKFFSIVNSLPSRIDAWDDPAIKDNKYMKAFYLQLQKTKPDPKVPEWEQIVFEKLRVKAEYIARGDMKVEPAMKQLDKEVNSVLEKRRWLIETGKLE